MKFKLKIVLIVVMVLYTILFFVLYKRVEAETKGLVEINIPKEILNKSWNYYIYKYKETPEEDFIIFEKRFLKRYAYFLQNGRFENVYFSKTSNSYLKTYGNWVLTDSTLAISFKKDKEWVYMGNNDSVKIVGYIKRFSKECFILVTNKRTEGKRYNALMFKCTDKVKLLKP